MKKKLFPFIIIIGLFLTGCIDTSSFSFNTSSNSTTNTSINTTSISTPSEGTATLEIFSSNDIHGQVLPENGRSGIGAVMTFFKQRKDSNPNTLLLDQGDTWQGSIYSNYNHGELITDIMNYVKFDARAIGNHDFDWGVDYIKKNTAKSYQGYKTPVLAGNAYDYNFDTKVVGNTQQAHLGGKSVTYMMPNGLKVGILGGIGKDQITSITSSYTKNIAFKDHIQFIKDEATHLRNDEKCNIVIASIHTGKEDVLNNSLSSYVDLVLCGHTHRQEYSTENGVYFVQNKAYTESFGNIKLTYDFSTKKVTKTTVKYLTGYDILNNAKTIDPVIANMIESYNAQCDAAANEVLANNVADTFTKGEYAENIMAKSVLEEAIKEGYEDVCVSYINVARHDLHYGSWTYADLYQAFPFDNEVYIAEVTGYEFKYQVTRYNYICKNPDFTTTYIDFNKTYKIAVLDYVYFHTNSERDYDYFSNTGGTSTITLSKTYREILKDWLKTNGYNQGKTLNTSDYSSSNWEFDNSSY